MQSSQLASEGHKRSALELWAVRLVTTGAEALTPAAEALGPRWRERLGYLRHLAEQGRFARALALAVSGPPRIAARSIVRLRTARLLRAQPDARPLNAEWEYLEAHGRIAPTPPLERAEADPLISVVIPCFNYGRFLQEAIDSVRAQTLTARETIIVDDGSTDGETIEVLQRLSLLPNERLIRQENVGLPGARNAGIAEARGVYICCLDADDVLAPRYLQTAVEALEMQPDAGFAYSNVRLFGNEEGLWRTRPFDLEEALRNNHACAGGVFRRADWQIVGGYDPGMIGGYEDWAFWLSLASIGRRGAFIRQPLFLHRKHGPSMTARAHAQRARLIARMRRRRPELFGNGQAYARRLAFVTAPAPSLARGESPILDRLVAPVSAGKRPLTIITPHLVAGGAETILKDVLAEVSDEYDAEVYTTATCEQHALEDEFAPFAQRIAHLPDLAPQEVWLDHLVSRAQIRGAGVILSCGSSFLYRNAAALRARLPYVRWLDILHTDQKEGHIEAALTASPSIDLLIAGAAGTFATLAARGIAEEKRVFIQNGVDIERFNPNAIDRETARKRFGIDPQAFVLGFVGRMAVEKRPETAAQIAKEVGRAVPSCVFLAIGDGPLAKRAVRRVPGAVWRPFLPDRGDIALAYRAMDAFILPSSVEAMPLVILEAMAMGLPVLSTDVGDVRHAVEHGATGYLAPREDPMALRAGALALARDADLRARMGRAARERLTRLGWTRQEMLIRYRRALRGGQQ